MPETRTQFRVLCRNFLTRIIDVELLASRGDISKLLGQFTAILAAFSFTVAICFAPRFATSGLQREKLMTLAWNDVEFLIATSIAVTGIFSVLAWNTVFPDRRDCLVLGQLPLRTRTIVAAKLAAMGAGLGIALSAVNIFTGMAYPFILAPERGGILAVLRGFSAYWIATFSAGLFVACALVGVQGLAAQLLPRRTFLKTSSFLQLLALFAVVAIYFLEPPLPPAAALRTTVVNAYGAWLPSFWFFGLLQRMNGSSDPAFAQLAGRAVWSLAFAFVTAAATFALAWRRDLRRIVEQPEIVPTRRPRRVSNWLAARVMAGDLQRAVLQFIARTLARSRQHRLLLALYSGIGLAIALVYTKDLLYHDLRATFDRFYALTTERSLWNRPNEPLLVASLVILVFAVVGARAAFAVPIVLPANWVFRITAVEPAAAYFSAVRRSLYLLTAAPVWAASAVFFAIWPPFAALEHAAVLIAVGVLLIEASLHTFRKLPFTCSYLPGKANIHVKLGIWAIVFLFVTDRGVAIELWAMERPTRFLVFVSIVVLAALWARHRTSEFASYPHHEIQFEDVAPAAVDPIVLLTENA